MTIKTQRKDSSAPWGWVAQAVGLGAFVVGCAAKPPELQALPLPSTTVGVVITVGSSGNLNRPCMSVSPVSSPQLVSIDLRDKLSDYHQLVVLIEPLTETRWDVKLMLVGPSVKPREVSLGEVKLDLGGTVGVPLVRDGQPSGTLLFVSVTPTDDLLETLSGCMGRVPHESGLLGIYGAPERMYIP